MTNPAVPTAGEAQALSRFRGEFDRLLQSSTARSLAEQKDSTPDGRRARDARRRRALDGLDTGAANTHHR